MPAVTAARVTVIPAKKDRLPINVLSSEARKLRVAAYYRTGAFRPRTIRVENPQDGWAFYELPASIFRAHYLRRVWRHLWQQGLALQHGKPEPCMAV